MKNNTKVACIICNGEASIIEQNQVSYIEGLYLPVYSCKNCNTHFVVNENSDLEDIYQFIYENAETLPGYNRYYYYQKQVKTETDPLHFLSKQEAMYWAVNRCLEVYAISKTSSILEVGSGLGYLTYALNKSGYNAQGIDISQNAVDAAKKELGNYYECADIFDLCKADNMKHDFIILNEVIEHVSEPIEFVQCLLNMLTENGKLVITTPDKSVSIPHSVWDTDLPPVHLSWLSDESMRKIAARFSVNLEFVDFSDFNAKNFDKMRFKIYRPYKRYPLLDQKGRSIISQQYTANKKRMKHLLQSGIARLARYKPFDFLFTRKEYPMNKNNTMACVLYK